jgi:hypothetical protein
MDIVERLRFGSPSYVLIGDAAIEIERLQKENELLQKELKKHLTYQDHRHGRIGTHDPICYEYGPRHYECALRKIDMLRELLNADNQTLRLHLGELTLKEMRIVKAAFQWVLIRAELKENE